MKGGYYYTFTVLFFTGILLAVFFSQTDVMDSSTAQQKRIATMDDFLQDLHRDIDRAAFISGFRALLALEENIATNGSYFASAEVQFREAFVNGTVNGVSYTVLENATFGDYVERVQYEASTYGMNLDIQVVNVSLYHITPWELAVDYDAIIALNDTRDTTRWRYDKSFSTRISILSLRDPMYSVETNNKLPNTIRIYPDFVEFVDDAGDANDTTVLGEFLNYSYYSPNPLAPSFLKRFEGNFSSDEFGIESLVNLIDLDDQGVPVYDDRTVVDYLYFEGLTAPDNCSVKGNPDMPEFFKIDGAHYLFYELDELETSGCI